MNLVYHQGACTRLGLATWDVIKEWMERRWKSHFDYKFSFQFANLLHVALSYTSWHCKNVREVSEKFFLWVEQWKQEISSCDQDLVCSQI